MDPHTEPHWDRAALLTIDVQEDFVHRAGDAHEAAAKAAILTPLAELLTNWRAAGFPIVHVVRLYLPDGSNAERCRRAQLAAGGQRVTPHSPGAELVAALRPSPEVRLDARRLLGGELQLIGTREWILYKPRWGAFFRTQLEDHLRSLGVDTVLVAGCNYPNCPRATIYEASSRDFRVVFVRDAISGLDAGGAGELRAIGAIEATTADCTEQVRI